MKKRNLYVEFYDAALGDTDYKKSKYFSKVGAAERYAKKLSKGLNDAQHVFLYFLDYRNAGVHLRCEYWQGKHDAFGDIETC